MDHPSPADGDETRRSDARRSRRRSRQAADALIVDTPQAALPGPALPGPALPGPALPGPGSAPATLPDPGANATPDAPASRSTRRQRSSETAANATGTIHLKSEAIDAPDQAPDAATGKKKPAAASITGGFRHETSLYIAYAYRLIFSRLILVVAILCFVWALWQAFQAVVNSYYLNLSLLPQPGVSLRLAAWAAAEIASLAPFWMPNLA